MEVYAKVTAGVLLTTVLTLTIGRQERDLAVVLSMAVCCMASIAAFSALRPVVDFLYRLEAAGGLQEGAFRILLKILGIGLLSEVAGHICHDAGNDALGKSLHLLGTVVMLQLSLPVMETLLTMIGTILGEL